MFLFRVFFSFILFLLFLLGCQSTSSISFYFFEVFFSSFFFSCWILNKNILLFSRRLKLSYVLNHLSRLSNDVNSFITSYRLSCFVLSFTTYCLFNTVVITPASYLFWSSLSHALSTISNIIFNLHFDPYHPSFNY